MMITLRYKPITDDAMIYWGVTVWLTVAVLSNNHTPIVNLFLE
jgi:hypothetical protein